MVQSLTPFGLGQSGCWTSRGSQLPWALPFIFSLCCLLNDCKRAAHSFLKIGHLFSLSLGRVYLSLNFYLLSLFDPYSDYVGVNVSLNNCCHFLMCMPPPPIHSSLTDGRTDSFSHSIISSRNLFILGDFNCHHPLWDSRGTPDPPQGGSI